MTEFGRLHPDGRYEHVRSLSQAAMLRCPHFIIAAEHYRDDETCKCNDATHTQMAEWGYMWDGARWVAPADDEED